MDGIGAPSASLETAERPKEDLWEAVGFHRMLGGFFYKIVFTIFHIVMGIVTALLLFPIMFPFPETKGYYDTATSLFGAVYIAFDLGTANMMNRYIGEHGTKDPAVMLKYLQYFIWYQAFSGLVQVTMIACWALYAPVQSLLHFTWIFLLYSTVQYPAYQGVFKHALEALQQFHKSSWIGFLEGDIFQASMEIGMVIIFRYTLGANVEYGLILAISIGLVLGKYLDDFVVMLFGMKMFSQVMGKYGIRVRDCFGHDFDRHLVKDVFLFGIKTGFPGAISGFVGLMVLSWWLTVPQYTTFIALLSVGQSIVNFVQHLKLDLGGSIAESYMNGKKALAQYYIGQVWRFDMVIQLLFYVIIFGVSLVLGDALLFIGLDYYLLAVPFIMPTMVRRFFNPYFELPGAILTSSDKPNVAMGFGFLGLGLGTLSWYLFLVLFQLPQTYGSSVLFWLMPAGDIFAAITVAILSYTYIHKKMIRIKIPLWQTVGAPGIMAGLTALGAFAWYFYVYIPMREAFGAIVALIPMAAVFCFVLPVFLWIPGTVFLGGWDEASVSSFEKAARISGVGKFIANPMFKSIKWAVSHARLHGRFKMDDADAMREAEELMTLKRAAMKKA
ncbi:MAG: hypothetical protein JW839_14165 [Candidatus Lokiarchaeota archaeon]|nr:hypothetical protein [Candidatus Lokiarchaeota archaeon]